MAIAACCFAIGLLGGLLAAPVKEKAENAVLREKVDVLRRMNILLQQQLDEINQVLKTAAAGTFSAE